MTLAGRRVAVIGLAATGLSTARVLSERGASVTVYDGKPLDALAPERVAALAALGVPLCAGGSVPVADFDLIVPSPGVRRTAPPIADAIAAGIEIASEIEVAGWIAKAPILGVTGTNGKTTTTAMLAQICRAAGRETIPCGNLAEDEGKRLPLIEAADRAVADAVLVAEISSFQLEWTRTFRPRGAAWLNLSVDHLDAYPSLDAYAADKAKLFAAQTEDDVAVLNADDPMVVRCATGVGRGRRAWFHGDAPILPEVVGLSPQELQVPGKHNVANACAAALVALGFGIKPSAVAEGLRTFTGVAHRMETVGEIGGVRYVNNSMCTNPAAVAASVSAVDGGLIAIAGGRHKGGSLADMATALASRARLVVLIGEATDTLERALADAGASRTMRAGSLPAAVEMAAGAASPGETVMLVPGCASFDMFTGFEHRGQVFRDAVKGLAG